MASNVHLLADAVGARYWGPGRFRTALHTALEDGQARRIARDAFASSERTSAQLDSS